MDVSRKRLGDAVSYALEKSSSLRTEEDPLALGTCGCLVTSARTVSVCGGGRGHAGVGLR